MFKLRVRGEARVGEGLLESLDARTVYSGADFSALTKVRVRLGLGPGLGLG